MLLKPSNTLLMDEPTNHLDLESKDVLLDALADYGGTLIMVSHDRYFVEKLATKIIEIGHGQALVYPGTYKEFLWHKEQPQASGRVPASGSRPRTSGHPSAQPQAKPQKAPDQDTARSPKPEARSHASANPANEVSREERKRVEAERRKQQRAAESLRARIADLESRIAERETAVKELEATMAAPGFYEDRDRSKTVIDKHQALMWEVGDLISQWEALQDHANETVS
jgi:ATP-binding cassette subfamily F protein 3